MAGDDHKAEKYIVNVPYSVLLSISQSLDADKGWERLAGETGYTFDKIRLLELEYGRNQGSPSRSLLWELGSRNTTVRQLYGYLNSISRYREMKILEEYVNSPITRSTHDIDNGLKGLKPKSMDTDSSNSPNGYNSCGSSEGKKNNTNISSSSFNFNSQSGSDVNNSMKCFPKDKQYSGKHIPVDAASSSTPPHATGISSSDPKSIHIPAMMKPPNPSKVVPSSSTVNLIKNMISQIPNGASPSGGVGRLTSGSDNSSAANRPSPVAGSKSSSSTSLSPLSDLALSSGLSFLPGLDSSLDLQMGLMGSACFKYTEILQATNNFDERNKIGEGAFGAVYVAVLRHIKCAVKKLFEETTENTIVERSTQVMRELTSLLKFRHENIVTLYGYALEGESLCLVYQYMHNGSLEDRIFCKNGTVPLVWSQRINILLGASQGLNFLHSVGQQPLIHGDIKSANILLDKHMEAKIGDLGQAQQATSHSAESNTTRHTHITKAQTTTKLYGTRAYQAPELQAGNLPSTKSDVFSIGVVILELFSGEHAYDERREGEKFLGSYFQNLKETDGVGACLSRIDKRGGECPQEVAQALFTIADKCCSKLKRKRPTADQLTMTVAAIDELYKKKTGIKTLGPVSMPGSETSCYQSHSSSSPISIGNMGAAPSGVAHSQNSAIFDINLNKDSPMHVAHLHHVKDEGKVANHLTLNTNRVVKPGKCLPLTMHTESTPVPEGLVTHRQPTSVTSGEQSVGSTPSPLEYFQDKPLPPAFRIQMEYDKLNSGEKKIIDRHSECLPSGDATQTEVVVLPASDPAKLAMLEQFDRVNLGGSTNEKDANIFESDPKKIAALKQFDGQSRFPTISAQNTEEDSPEGGDVQGSSLACDPQKLAYLSQFDENNLGHGSIVQQTQREEEAALASDPQKLATLTQFDQANSASAAGLAYSKDNGNGSLISQEDFLVTSQGEALKACNSLLQHHQHGQDGVFVQQPIANPSCHMISPTAPTDCTPQDENRDSESQLLTRRNNFFDLYNQQRLAELNDDDNDDNVDEAEENGDEGAEERENYETDSSLNSPTSVREWASYNTPRAEEMVSMCAVVTGQLTNDQESLPDLNYYRGREHHYEKVYKKAPQTG